MAGVVRAAAVTGAALALAWPGVAQAYVGPGAGVAFLTTATLLLTTLVLTILGLLSWPLRFAWRLLRRKKAPRPPRIRRAVIVGLDGLDPDLVQRFMAEGRLPNMARLAEEGTFDRLATTYPAMSPVAWSTFATGVAPAKHGVFDFLTRHRSSYLPALSSAEVAPPRRHLAVGPYRLPLGRPRVRLLRKSRSFWRILGEHGVPSSVLRVPITFPPERFDGTLLSAMCVPDLEGTQGTFTYFSSADAEDGPRVGGRRVPVAVEGGRVAAALEGPDNPVRPGAGRLKLPFSVELLGQDRARLRIGGTRLELRVGEDSAWVPVAFPMGLGLKLRGICRFRLLEAGPAFRLYASPINIDPAHPILPISHPFIFSVFLAKLCGRFATLGLAEDTWALNEGVLDEDAFLAQAWANHGEREAMFFQMLRRTPRGLTACVFDGTDRIQHMFMRFHDAGHPAARGEDAERVARYGRVIEDTYARADDLVGRTMAEVGDDPRTLLVVLSDHGFKTFRRGMNVNSWLHENGYLTLESGRTRSGEWFEGVDWSRTRAFALGLGGIFLNVKGREPRGIVEPGAEARDLASEIARKLGGLRDQVGGGVAVSAAYPAHSLYRGPYAEDAPDVVVGYAAGWRASWDGVRGIVDGTVFDDNEKAWSGDHCIDPKLVPGVLLANRPLRRADGTEASISDIAPTVLDLFGIDRPRYMDGQALVER